MSEDDEDLSTLSSNFPELTKKDIEQARYKEKLRSIQRQGMITSANAWIGFAVCKGIGLTALTVGGLEWIAPDILPIVLQRPEIFAGAGLALLTGKSIINLIARADKVFKE